MSERERRRYLVVGAGAIGGTIGGVLARAGAEVILIARGEHAAKLRSEPLVLRTPDDTFEIPVAVAADPAEVRLRPEDVLVFATKTQQLDAALQTWADQPVYADDELVGAAGELLPVLTALNGVVAEEKALRYFARVFGVCVWMPAAHVQPGEVIVRAAPVAGQFHIARWPAQLATTADRELLAEIAQTWTAAGIRITLPDDVAPWKYNKLLSNLTNAVVALTGAPNGADEIQAALVEEAERVLNQAGIAFVSAADATAARADGPKVRQVPNTEGIISNSTWQSLARNSGSVETDFLNGEIVRIAHQHGSTAPVNAALARLARDAAHSGRPPGQFTADELAAELGLTSQVRV